MKLQKKFDLNVLQSKIYQLGYNKQKFHYAFMGVRGFCIKMHSRDYYVITRITLMDKTFLANYT